MADDDEIDILGDFSFNSCFAQNDQGIPSCSNREDTVHPEWLLDSTATNWYDKGTKEKHRDLGHSRKLLSNNTTNKLKSKIAEWNQCERELLQKEVEKHGRDIFKISQIIKTKTKEEIQAVLYTEYGLKSTSLEEASQKKKDGSKINSDTDHVETFSSEASNLSNVLNMVSTGSPTIIIPKVELFKKKNNNMRSKKSLIKPDDLNEKSQIQIDPSEIYYEDDLIIGSTESIGSDLDLSDIVSNNIVKYQAKVKNVKKIGNHRRKISRNYEKKPRNKSKEILKSPQGRQRKETSFSDESVKSPKMQIILGSGQALPVSEGEQVIKIEKKKDSEPESDVDVDSDNEKGIPKDIEKIKSNTEEAPIAVPLRKFEPMPRRQKRINLAGGGGGYTIMHTESGDLYEVASEPRRERQRKQHIHLIQCRIYNSEKPAPFEVRLHVSTLIVMDVHAHTSRGEVMGLTGGLCDPPRVLTVWAYRAAAAAADSTHCEMDAVSQAAAAEALSRLGANVCGWHHSHPRFPSSPSALDLATQRYLQRALHWSQVPFLGFITSQHWPTGRTASQYRCIRVEEDDLETETPIGYQFSVKLVDDLDVDNLHSFLQEVRRVTIDGSTRNDLTIDMVNDICPEARITYLDKCISSVRHHMRSAGYADDHALVPQLLEGIRDIFR